MKRATTSIFGLLILCLPVAAVASEAETSATAGTDQRSGGSAAATARHEGTLGFANTQARTGQVSVARGVAVGVDEGGISLSVSHAVSTGALAIARNFNLSIGRDGQVAVSGGGSVSLGAEYRSATSGGATAIGRRTSAATSFASGQTDRRGTVQTNTFARSTRPAQSANNLRALPRVGESVGRTARNLPRVSGRRNR